jgi:hypothetical protein
MTRRLAVLGFASLLLVAAGCPAEKSTPSGSAPVAPVVISDAASVTADGTQFVTITVSSGRAPISLTTTRGAFSNGLKAYTMSTVPGTVTLTPCNARTQATCAGPAVVAATTAEYTSTSVTVTFEGYENCSNGVDDNGDDLVDCADPQCPLDSACGANGLVCSGTQQCNKCTAAAGVAIEPSGETSCGDGADNDCDGLIDCADNDCAAVTCATAGGSAGVCDAGACVCDKTETRETTCGDGKDNDCDNLIDCADPDCLGKICDGNGKVCPGPAPSTCGVCLTGSTETAAQCGDGKDNDCDGLVDCYDPNCQPAGATPGQACNAYGGRCILTSGVPSCGCSTGATTETSCQGGTDDDCDGLIDCADPDCQPSASGVAGPVCGPNGRACTSAGACECPGGTVELCDNYDAAGQAVDDNCDGRANCQDFSCRPTVPGGVGEDCSPVGSYGMACDATGACACTGNGGTTEVAELSCADGFDNDCDYLIDCADANCSGRSCGPGGAACSGNACVCPTGSVESSCTDGVDNNCNGKIDCEEPSCASLACNGNPTPYTCISGVCTDPATRYGLKVTAARSAIPADGVASTTVEIEVKYDGAAKSGVTVALTLPAPVLGTILPASVTTNSLGKATATFTSTGGAGVQTVVATVTGVGATGSGTIALPAIGEMRVLDPGGILYAAMGVKNSGFQEQNQLVVEILDTSGKAYPEGLAVSFEHPQLGGSTLSDPIACVGVANCVTTATTTDASGLARVRLYSGTVAGSMGVAAQATAGGILRRFQFPAIAVVGAKANAGHFSIVCSPENVPALASTTCYTSNVDAPITCAAYLKDRYNNVLGRPTTVSFMSEAGAVGPPAVTPEYDPTQPASGQTELGTAVEFINTLGGKLPKDVAPAGEIAVSTTADPCGVSQYNPRDGLVTIVAWVPGEEAFFDANGDGEYTPGEPFVDLPEPFVDYDDDDVRDGDEPFIDTNGNGTWNGPNLVWDASTNVWTKTVVVYSGMPAFLRMKPVATDLDYLSRWVEPADYATTFAAATPVASFAVRPAFEADPFNDCNTNNRRDVAALERYDDLNKNGVYDVGEQFLDCNANGVFDGSVGVPETYVDVNGNGVYDAVPSPATSDGLIVTASDRNLNRLAEATTYAVAQPEGTKFTMSYNGDATLPDRAGLSFAYRPCDSVTPTNCAFDCESIVASGGHCVMQTRVADFSYGYASSVTFLGGGVGAYDGSTVAWWEITLFGETLRIPVSGTHQ